MHTEPQPTALLAQARLLPPLADLIARAAAKPRAIAFSEGSDPRVIEAVAAGLDARMLRAAHLVGPAPLIKERLAERGLSDDARIIVHDPDQSELFEPLAERFQELRSHKKISIRFARRASRDPLVYTALLVETGHADGCIGGAVATTAQTLRAALQVIGKAPDAPLASSFFLMILPEGHPLGQDVMVFSDCGMVIDPDATELASIAEQAAGNFSALTGREARVAMLSFSTRGSARHPAVKKVTEATELLRGARPDLCIDGELQLDAALVPSVAEAKAPDSPPKGASNVLIFPNLDAGNIGYKMAQRFGSAIAIGPILQGLAKPANDLSRGCSAQDILAITAVTALQATMKPSTEMQK